MERDDHAPVAGFFTDGELASGTLVTLGSDASHHIRVRRLEAGDRVFLANGRGCHGRGTIVRAAKGSAVVSIEDVVRRERGPAVHLLAPVADRDRMLWLAEKCAELGIAGWRPVLWRRSRSVSPRGEGPAFAGKVRSRMIGALLQSRCAWLPTMHADAAPADAVGALPSNGTRLALDPGGQPLLSGPVIAPVTIAVGPEGGLESDELDLLEGAGFRRASVGANVLRFETAAVSAVAIAIAALAASSETAHG